MKQQEEQADTEVQVVDAEDFRYTRVGYVDQGRKSDLLLATFLELLPGNNRLPLHWHYRSHDHFLKKYKHLGPVLWAAANNSHLLVVNGFRVLRIWTDTSNSCWVDLEDKIADQLSQSSLNRKGEVQDIPSGNAKKSQPFTKRIKVRQKFQMHAIADIVKRTYGLDTKGF